ncbi:MAG: Gfo/Idh/MocA family oxidoreductase [Chloroflexota bacterium]|nr:MAG: Gfo/Idh/MocA family oxidoreductase [Chloroflexota bacterium]
MSRRVKIGLAGLGSVSQRGILPHLAVPDAQERIELAAVCDIVAERSAETASRYQVPSHYSDYDEMLKSADIEAVAIAGPIPVHYDQVMKALRAGKHVYVQKAMTVNLQQANDIVELRTKTGLKLVASPGQMLNRTQARIRDLIRDGALGKVYWAFTSNVGGGHEGEAFRTGGDVLSNVDPTWYYKKGGGPMYDMAVYNLHSLTGILGSVKRVSAMSGIGTPVRFFKGNPIQVEMDDNTLILLDFGDNTFAVATGQNCAGAPTIGFGRMTFFGTEGTIDMGMAIGGVEVNAPKRLQGTLGFPGGTLKYNAAGPDIPYVTGGHARIQEPHVYADIAHLAECIVENTDPVPSAEHARHVVEIIEKGYIAAQTGKTLELTSSL